MRSGSPRRSRAWPHFLLRIAGLAGAEPPFPEVTEMGSFNIVRADCTCPRCGTDLHDVEVECRFGKTADILTFRVGDSYPWVLGKMVHHGGRPENGNLDGEGYAECPHCRKDFFLVVAVRSDVIHSVAADRTKKGYIPD